MEPKAKTIPPKAFADIAARFPHLTTREDVTRQGEVNLAFPVQPGLRHEVLLCLDRDELHSGVENFHLEWFPCNSPAITNAFVDAVVGFISGDYRILEHYRGSKCVKAELQKPLNDSWITIGTSRPTLSLSIPWRTTRKELRNN